MTLMKRISLKRLVRHLPLLLLILTLSVATNAQAQNQQEVKGTVISSEDGEPITGATIKVVGGSEVTVTDIDGNFSFKVSENAKFIKVASIGMAEKQVPIRAGVMKVTLDSDVSALDEVMVVAYGTAKKGTFTGSASVVNLDNIDARAATEVTSSLLGATSGVTVQNATGEPGAATTIRIRGIGSMSASNDPLIVLDGMVYDGTINSINPSDVESITVLKDASSTALYGARAANGVLLINSKKGAKGKVKFTLKLNQGFTDRGAADYKRLGVNDYLETYWNLLYNNAVRDGNANPANYASEALIGAVSYNPFNDRNTGTVLDNNLIVLPETGKVNPDGVLRWSDDLDWDDACTQLGARTDAMFQVSGGSERTTYYGSLGYTSEDGYIKGANYKRLSEMLHITTEVTKWMKLDLSNRFSYTDGRGRLATTSGVVSNVFRFLRYVPPITPIHARDAETNAMALDPDGNYYYDFGTGASFTDSQTGEVIVPAADNFRSISANPAVELKDREMDYKRNRNDMKGFVEFKLPFDFKFTINANYTNNNYRYTTAAKDYPGKETSGTVTKTRTTTDTYSVNELLTYQHQFGKHYISALVGHENYSYRYEYLNVNMKSEIFSGNSELTNYTEMNELPTSYTTRYKTEGWLSRAEYNYDQRYFFSASFRRDGSSRFYKDNRWGNFWSVGASWRVDEEKFMKPVWWVDMLKIRTSYGYVGNDDLGSYYPWRSTYQTAQYGDEGGYIIGSLGNKDLKWEVSRNFDAAIEFEIFKKFRGSFEIYNRVSSNLLFSVPLTRSSGSSSEYQNAGTMYNRGFEFELAADWIKTKNWKFSTNFNLTYLKNKITKLPIDPFQSSYFKIEEGHSRYDFYVRQWEGVDPNTGNSLYLPDDPTTAQYLVEVDGKQYTTNINEAKWDWEGCGLAPWTGGLNIHVAYKQLSLDMTWAFQLGGQMYDTSYYQLMYPNYNSTYQNLSTDILKAWTQPGDITNVPRLADGDDATDLMAAGSTRWLISSNELDLANFILTYTFRKKQISKLGLSAAKIYVSGENMISFTKRQGLFPRFIQGGYTSNGDNYAPSRVFTAGVQISF